LFSRCYARSERFNPLDRCREPTLPIAFILERGGPTGIGDHVDRSVLLPEPNLNALILGIEKFIAL
jgi:hypothetical protein